MLSGEDAIWHSLRVSAGLDSLVVGEGQILAQVKRSYEKGIEPPNESGVCGQAGKVVSRLLNTAVAAGKRVRAETGISKGAVSISSAAAEFSAHTIKKTSDESIEKICDARITIIGAGKMSRLLLVHLQVYTYIYTIYMYFFSLFFL
jgi:glutamyl-tRNA reductase